VRVALGIIAGFLLAAFIAYGVEYINHFFWFPPDVNWFDPQEVIAFVPNLPVYAALPNLIGGIVGVYLGTRWAGRIARTGTYTAGIGVIALIILQGVAVQIVAPQEWWVFAVSAAAVLVAGYYGTRAGVKN
jgi:hypothetical protein